MHLLKEPVCTITYQLDYGSTFAALLSKLRELHIDVLKENKSAGEIVVRCLSSLMNIIVWRCWSDKLLFEIIQDDDSRTKVNIYALPNLFRIKIRKDEKVVDLNKFISQISLANQNASQNYVK